MALDSKLLAEALPRYELRGEIGRGGWGVVHEGWHRDLQRAVAIKQLPRAFGADPEVRDRFIAEAQLVAGLQHPHIVPVYDFVERDGLYLIVMELASGGTLWSRFSEAGLETDAAVAAVLATAVGLHHAHTRGLLHRDVKPENVLYTSDGTVKIADFGIAKSMGQTQAGRTATGSIIGTPAYMAPEQVTGGELAPATDVYAAGVMLYELLSGDLPFPPVTDAVAQLFQHVHEAPRPIGEVRPEVPAPLATAVHRALAKDPADRPLTAEEFAVELAQAATEVFGPGWLSRSGVNVMGSNAVIAATERTTGTMDRQTPTLRVQAQHGERLRLGELQSAAPHPDSTAPTLPPTSSAGAPPPADPAPAHPEPTSTNPDVAPPPAPTEARAAEHGSTRASRNRLPVAVGAVAAIVLVLVGIVLLSSGDGSDTNPPGPVADAEISDTERATFRTMCEGNDVSEARCECALERAGEQLEPAAFRADLADMVEQDGVLSPELAAIFEACVDDGF
jgi:serine/threonine-protein kinase